jgi:hypothetical protein
MTKPKPFNAKTVWRDHCRACRWEAARAGEPIPADEPVTLGERGHWSATDRQWAALMKVARRGDPTVAA